MRKWKCYVRSWIQLIVTTDKDNEWAKITINTAVNMEEEARKTHAKVNVRFTEIKMVFLFSALFFFLLSQSLLSHFRFCTSFHSLITFPFRLQNINVFSSTSFSLPLPVFSSLEPLSMTAKVVVAAFSIFHTIFFLSVCSQFSRYALAVVFIFVHPNVYFELGKAYVNGRHYALCTLYASRSLFFTCHRIHYIDGEAFRL